MSQPALFVDKDGTIVRDVPYNVDPARVELLPGAAEGLRRFQAAGYRVIVVSNQSGIARGLFAEADLKRLEAHLRQQLACRGVHLDAFLFCPHHPQGTVAEFTRRCDCRKPAPGMLLGAAAHLDLDLRHSWMAGDILDDVEAGNRAGCRALLINNGGETEWRMAPFRTPALIAPDLEVAATLALGQAVRRRSA